MVCRLRGKIIILMFGITLLLGLSHIAKASQFSTVSFTYGYIWGSLEFPEEAHPADSVTCNLTIVAYIDVNIYNFTLEISGLTGERWQTLHTEPILSHYLAQGENLTKKVRVTVPQNTSERLYYVIEASTDKGFGKTAFYGTYVRSIGYSELSGLYDDLLLNYSILRIDYNQMLANYYTLNSTYGSLVEEYNTIQANINTLNSSYRSLTTSYNSLMSNYDSLQEHYNYIKELYDSSAGELNTVRILMFVFGITTAILAATTIYFRKKAPYIVLRKETAAKAE